MKSERLYEEVKKHMPVGVNSPMKVFKRFQFINHVSSISYLSLDNLR